MSQEQTIADWIDKIHSKCEEHNVRCRLYLPILGGWRDYEEFKNLVIESHMISYQCDINLFNMKVGPEDSPWQRIFSDSVWVIPFPQLLNPEFQKDFEYEFNYRFLHSIFS
jgi:hypothetical protein